MILGGGREIFRAIYEVIKLTEMDFIVNDLSKEDEQGKIIFKRML